MRLPLVMAYCWMSTDDSLGASHRLPLYSCKLDLASFARIHDFNPADLSLLIGAKLGKHSDEEDEDHKAALKVDLDLTNGLSVSSLSDLVQEVQLLFSLQLPDGSSPAESLIFRGTPVPVPQPHWLLRLELTCYRGTVPIETVISHQFILIFRDSVGLSEDEPLTVFDDPAAEQPDLMVTGLQIPDEEAFYVDRRALLPSRHMETMKSRVTNSMPSGAGYHWLPQEQMDNHSKEFGVPLLNMDVLVSSTSSGVLALEGQPVLGINLVTDLTWQAVLRCEADYYLWALSSSLPHLQLVTDFKTGAVVFYATTSGVSSGGITQAMLLHYLESLSATLPKDKEALGWSMLVRRAFRRQNLVSVKSTKLMPIA